MPQHKYKQAIKRMFLNRYQIKRNEYNHVCTMRTVLASRDVESPDFRGGCNMWAYMLCWVCTHQWNLRRFRCLFVKSICKKCKSFFLIWMDFLGRTCSFCAMFLISLIPSLPTYTAAFCNVFRKQISFKCNLFPLQLIFRHLRLQSI